MVRSFFCFRLPTAGYIIGIVGALLSLMYLLVFSAIGFSFLDDNEETMEDVEHYSSSYNYTDNFTNSTDINQMKHDCGEALSELVYDIVVTNVMIDFVIITIFNLFNIIASWLLVVGINKKKPRMLIPWIINSAIMIFLNTIKLAFIGIFHDHILRNVDQEQFHNLIIWEIICIIVIGLDIYAWIAVRSLRKQLSLIKIQPI